MVYGIDFNLQNSLKIEDKFMKLYLQLTVILINYPNFFYYLLNDEFSFIHNLTFFSMNPFIWLIIKS